MMVEVNGKSLSCLVRDSILILINVYWGIMLEIWGESISCSSGYLVFVYKGKSCFIVF